MASEEELNREKELKELGSERARRASAERSIASETLSFTRDILNSIREESKSLAKNSIEKTRYLINKPNFDLSLENLISFFAKS